MTTEFDPFMHEMPGHYVSLDSYKADHVFTLLMPKSNLKWTGFICERGRAAK